MVTTVTNRLGQALALDEAAAVAERIGALNKECWWNAVRALRQCYRRVADAYYVEGHATNLIVAEHGWIEVAGRIVDPTPPWHQKDPTAQETLPVYFPARRFSVVDLKGIRPNGFPRVQAEGWFTGPHAVPYQESCVAAHAERLKCPAAVVDAWFRGVIHAPLPELLDRVTR